MPRDCATIARHPARLLLLLLALLPAACHLTNQTGEGTLGIAGDSAWTGYDRLLVVLEDGRGADTLYDGKLASLDSLARLPAGGYAGGLALFVIQGFEDGELAYEERRSYDGSRQQVVFSDIAFDRRRPTASAALDLRPDEVRLYLGGGSVNLQIHPASLREGGTLTWKTGEASVATVSQDGRLSPVGLGSTYVQAAAGDTLRDASAVRVVRDVPVVDPGAPDTTVPAGSAVAFHVNVTQEYGDVARFAWDLDGDGVFDDSSTGTAGQTRFATVPRTYGTGDVTVRFLVRDSEGNSAEATKRVNVSASAPKIDSLGARPLVVSIHDTVAFAALASGGGADLRAFAWDFDGDGTDERTGSLQGGAAAISGAHAYTRPDTYRVRLRIADANSVSQSAEVSVTVKLDPPIADAGIDRTASAGEAVRLRGADADSLGRIVSREWKCGPAGFTAAADSGTHVFMAPAAAGVVPCVYRVTDDDGLAAEDTVKVTVSEADAPTLSGFAPAETTVTIGDSVAFAGSARAGTADLKTYTLDIGGDETVEAQGTLSGRSAEIRAGRRFAAEGRFDALLTVADQAGKTATRTVRVIVLLDPPRAEAGDDTTVAAGARVVLRGTASDSLGTVALREWKIGSGQFGRVAGGDTAFDAPGTPGRLACIFRVTDDDGQTDEDTLFVTVSPSRIAELSDLDVSIGTLSPEFRADRISYSVSVTAASIRVTPTAAAGATIRVNDAPVESGAASDAIVLEVGPNPVVVRVTASDGATTKDYTVNVTRVSTDPTLQSVTFPAGGAISSPFNPSRTGIGVNATPEMTNFTVRPTATATGATILVDGVAVPSGQTSGNLLFPLGNSNHTIVVTAPDGVTTLTYTLTVVRPVPQSLRFGYAWIDSYLASHTLVNRVHNPAGAVDFVREGLGQYTVHFRGLAALVGAPGLVHATAYVDNTPAAYCKIVNWSGSTDLTARIACFNMSGSPAEARVNVLALFPRDGTAGQNAVVLADQHTRAVNSPYAPANAHTHSSAGTVTVTRRQTGNYYVQLAGLGGVNGGTPMVTAVGNGNTRCQVDDFNGNGPDMGVYVNCYAGNGTAADAQFSLSVLQPYTGTAEGVAVARVEGSSGTVEYAFNNGGGGISVEAIGPGQWRVTFVGLASRGGTRFGNVQVAARFAGPVSCQSGGWSAQGGNLVATVTCFDETGAYADSMSSFLVWVLK